MGFKAVLMPGLFLPPVLVNNLINTKNFFYF